MVTNGGFEVLYPRPPKVITIDSIDFASPTDVVIATAVASSATFPVGEDEIPIVGIDEYEDPSSSNTILLTTPSSIEEFAVAVVCWDAPKIKDVI